MIYIDDGKTVKICETKAKVEKAILTLLLENEDFLMSETHEGYEVRIVEKE